MKIFKKISLAIFLIISLFFSSKFSAQQLVKASEVTPAYLKILCATNGLSVTEMNENFIKINNGVEIYLDIDKQGEFIILNNEYKLSDKATPEQALELSNTINKEVVFISTRFHKDSNTIEYRYYFWIKDGFTDQSLISAIAMYKDTLNYSLGKDKDLLIQ